MEKDLESILKNFYSETSEKINPEESSEILKRAHLLLHQPSLPEANDDVLAKLFFWISQKISLKLAFAALIVYSGSYYFNLTTTSGKYAKNSISQSEEKKDPCLLAHVNGQSPCKENKLETIKF